VGAYANGQDTIKLRSRNLCRKSTTNCTLGFLTLAGSPSSKVTDAEKVMIATIKSFGGLRVEALTAFALRNCLMLPQDYKQFLIENNGGTVVPAAGCYVRGLEETVTVSAFFGLTGRRGLDLQRWLDEYRDEMPEGFLIIAGDPGGELLHARHESAEERCLLLGSHPLLSRF
jgi:hypothetical protein